jgi:tetratricopeptide (TPR) repeat protein
MMWIALALSVGPAAPTAQQAPVPAAAQTPAQTTTAATGEAYFLFLQGRMLEGRGDIAGAIAAYRAAIGLMPAAADIRAELSGLYAREGRADEAIAEAEAALKVEPANHEANRILGLVRSSMADGASSTDDQGRLVVQAIGHLELALAGGRRDPGVEISLGRLYVRTGQHAKAIPTLEGFLTDQPGYPEGVLLLVEALDATGQDARAIAVLEPLVRDEPDLARARSWLAELYDATGRQPEALVHWRELAKTNPRNVPIRTRFAASLVNLGHLEEGRTALLELAGEFPRDIAIWYLVAQVETRAGNTDAAENAARRIVEIDSSDPRGPLAMAEARAARGDHRGVVQTLQPLLAALRTAPDTSAYGRVAVELAAAFEAGGDRDQGIRVLEDARTRDEQNVDVAAALASAYLRDKRHDLAERAYRDLLTGDPDNPAYLDGLGWTFVQQGQAGLAREPLERAVKVRPSDSEMLDHLAEALFQLKQYREAVVAWERALAGDRDGIDVEAVTRKRDRARQMAGRQ